MGILKGIFKARDKPKDTLGGSRYNFFCGSTSSGKPVNEHTAMQMTAVYSCVRASAADGSAKYADAYARLCVSVTDANGNLRDSAICRDKKAPFSFIRNQRALFVRSLISYLITVPMYPRSGVLYYISDAAPELRRSYHCATSRTICYISPDFCNSLLTIAATSALVMLSFGAIRLPSLPLTIPAFMQAAMLFFA